MEKLLTIPQIAALLQISKAKAYLLIQKKQIPHVKLDRNVRVKESDLVAFIEKQTVPAK